MFGRRDVLVLVLGGGRGTRLQPLTKYRAKPAVPLAGKYRLIDIPLSNCINSGLNRIYVLTQFLSVSLHRHIRQTYRFDAFSGGFVELLAAQQTDDAGAGAGADWYQGTADAVRKNLRYLLQPDIRYVLILSGDQLYRMDYRTLLKTHVESEADATIAAIPVSRKDARSFGIMRIDNTGQVHGFLEKPKNDREIDMVAMDPEWLESRGISSDGRDCLASMGIYVFDRDFLVEVVTKTTYADFGKEVFPAAIRSRKVFAHPFDGYWEDIGTTGAFYDANLALTREDAPFELECPEAPIYSRARFLPPTTSRDATIRNSIIADGCRIGRDVVIEESVIGLRCLIGDGAVIRRSILMGADEYETRNGLPAGVPPIGIGARTVVEGAIVDKNCRIGTDVRIVNDAGVEEDLSGELCVVRNRIPVIVKGATLPDGWSVEQAIGVHSPAGR